MSASAAVRKVRRWAHVVVIGAGGNIGSHLTILLARLPAVRRLTLIDPDAYDESNLASQNISRAALGRPKVSALAEVVRDLGEVEVEALPTRVEDAPMGRLRGDLLVSCPDSRRARQAVSRLSWMLGVPWVDSGVEAAASLARVTVRTPAEGAACYDCSLGPQDRAALSQEYGCAGAGPAPVTGAPAWLGGLAAALQAAECAHLLDDEGPARSGWQWTLDACSGAGWVTRFRRNPACPFDHARWCITPVPRTPRELTAAEALALSGAHTDGSLKLFGHAFARRLVCESCAHTRETLRLARRLDGAEVACPSCSGTLGSSAFHEIESLNADVVAATGADPSEITLGDLGFLPGDVITVNGSHLQLGG